MLQRTVSMLASAWLRALRDVGPHMAAAWECRSGTNQFIKSGDSKGVWELGDAHGSQLAALTPFECSIDL